MNPILNSHFPDYVFYLNLSFLSQAALSKLYKETKASLSLSSVQITALSSSLNQSSQHVSLDLAPLTQSKPQAQDSL
jgi:hypothetical protein